MRAIVFDRYGPPAALRVGEVPEPELADGRVLVRVEAVGLNPLDWHEVRGDSWMLRLQRGLRVAAPRVAAADLAGTVVAVADDVTDVAVGDRVVGSTVGALAEVARVRVASLAVRPPQVSAVDAAALPVAGVMALQALRDAGALAAGERVLVRGASGGVGHLAVQLARILGASRVDTVASSARESMLRELGVDVVHDREGAAPTGPLDVIVDTVSTASVATLQRMLAPGGRVVTIGGLGDGRLLGPLAPLVRRTVVGALRRVRMRAVLADVRAGDLGTASGALRPVVAEVVPFEAAADALDLFEAGPRGGQPRRAGRRRLSATHLSRLG